jgi:hypothetical protein
MTDPYFRARALLSIQRALLGEITPSMRVIDTCWNHRQIVVRIVVDSECTEEISDIANGIEAEVEGDFFPQTKVRVIIEHIPQTTAVAEFTPFHGEHACVFSRKRD